MFIRTSVSASLLFTLAASGFVGGCTDRPYSSPQEQASNACRALGPKALSGALIGGLGGAATGAAIGSAGGGRAAGIGALVGLGAGLLGGFVVGKQLDAQDCLQAQVALQQLNATPIGQSIYWTNPATGSHGDYVPLSAQYSANGQVCRQIRADYYIKNRQPVTGDSGVVCRTPEGDWVRQGAPGQSTPDQSAPG